MLPTPQSRAPRGAKAVLDGDGVVKDPARAKVLFSRSQALLQPECERGNARACGQAGWFLERGLGLTAAVTGRCESPGTAG